MNYTEEQIKEVFNSIIERIEKGEAVRTILLGKEMPSSRTFFKWLDNDKDMVKQYARATEYRAEHLFEEIIEIADNPEIGYTEKEKDGVIETTKGDMLGHRRLQIDARKWYLSKLNPKKYGDKTEVKNINIELPLSEEEIKQAKEKLDNEY
jgi:hypothetical protein